MELMALGVLIGCSVIGFVAIFCTTIGTLIILLGAFAYAWLTDFVILSPTVLFLLAALYLMGELVEYVMTFAGVKWFGASTASGIGALVGGVLGAIFGLTLFGVGLIVGTFVGIFVGAFFVEIIRDRTFSESLKAGLGGVLGRVGSIATKVLIACVMFGLILARLLTTAPI